MNFNSLKNPISEDAPGGSYLKGDRKAYRSLRNVFNTAQTAYRAFSESQESLVDKSLADANRATWAEVADATFKTLCETSKDIEIFCWFLASLAHGSRPIARLLDGLSVLVEMLEADVNALQPIPPAEKLKADKPEEQGSEIAGLKLRPFVQLLGDVEGSGLLYAPLANLPLIGELSFGQFLIEEKNGHLAALKKEASAVLQADVDTITSHLETLTALVAVSGRLDTVLKNYAQQHAVQAPTVAFFVRHLEELQRFIKLLAEDYLPLTSQPASENTPPNTDDTANVVARTDELKTKPVSAYPATTYQDWSQYRSRDEALAAIAELAQFFRKFEPHSPICLLLDRAVRWGNLSVGDLYREILTEGTPGMSQMALMTGLESQGFSEGYAHSSNAAPQVVKYPSLSASPDGTATSHSPTANVQTPVAQPSEELAPEPSPTASGSEPTDTSDAATDNLEVANFEW